MSNISDPIGDLLTRMRNAQHARRKTVLAPWSGLKQALCELLKTQGWVMDVQVIGEVPHQEIEVTFDPAKPVLELKRVSKPGQRIYIASEDLRPVLHGFGSAILTTSQGLMTDREARRKKIGGEVLCTIA